ncbi:hypothetical protein AJ80_07856 [Polytolypa hystricis UAMH7299]|uniref:Uncharacterized protein n=1 Tax=Polytolypa hystricis (strain UAMH7299) TaxID=1447883 RepID=A0A2B7XIJ2_POLH7|nr:hypothetical protein AJ80_07856 [Polytolypa hystricis UAMH7299]
MGRCFLCGTKIGGPRTETTAWRARPQRLQLRPDGHPLSIDDWYETVHSVCWSVVLKVLGPFEVDGSWLQKFCAALYDLHVLLDPIPFDECPGCLDDDIDMAFENGSLVAKTYSQGVFDKFGLPSEVVQIIYSHLDSYHDVLNLQPVALYEPGPAIWLSFGQKFIAYGAPFTMANPLETLRKVQRVLQNLHQYPPSRFPHSTNYATVWGNTELIIEKMEQPMFGLDATNIMSRYPRYVAHYATQFAAREKLIIHLREPSKISFNFTHVRDRRYLCGLAFDGNTTGYVGNSYVTASHKELYGLRLVSDGYGYRAVQVRDAIGWDANWYGSLPQGDDMRSVIAQLEWPSSHDGSLVLYIDSFKVDDFMYMPDASKQLIIPPIAWYSKLPSQEAKPVFLHENSHLFKLSPFEFFDQGFEKTTCVSAFVKSYTDTITGLEFTIGGGRLVSLGKSDPLGIKLSFLIDVEGGETLEGLACAVTAMRHKVFTNFGRCAIFGDPTTTKWKVAHRPSGVFCACISVMGTFHYEANAESKHVYPLKQPTTWSMAEVEMNGCLGSMVVFLSKADFTSVSRITVSRRVRKGYICGMRISHMDGTEDILGEAKDEVWSYTFKRPITAICADYSFRPREKICRIKGLRFICGSEQVSIGDLDEAKAQSLDISNVSYILPRFADDPPTPAPIFHRPSTNLDYQNSTVYWASGVLCSYLTTSPDSADRPFL